MATWYPTSGLSWSQYLQASPFSGDIKAEITRQSRRVSEAVVSGSHEIIGTTVQLQAAFSEDSEQIAEALFDLGVQFDYSMGLVLDALEAQSQHLQVIVQHLDAIKKTLESPLLTQARELFRIGCDRLAKGLLDKALEAFLEAERKNDTDFFIEYYIGKLYLYGRDEDDNVIDLPLARQHLLSAVRYGKAEIPSSKPFGRLTGEALFHASVAYYALAGEEPATGTQRIGEAYDLVAEAVRLYPDLSEAWFHAAKYKAVLGDATESLNALQRAVARDPRYVVKAASDGAFSPIRPALTDFLDHLRCEKRAESEAALREATAAFARSQAYHSWRSPLGKARHDDAESHLARANEAHNSSTYFGYLDAIASSSQAVKAAWESRRIREEAEIAEARRQEETQREEQRQAEQQRQIARIARRRRRLAAVRAILETVFLYLPIFVFALGLAGLAVGYIVFAFGSVKGVPETEVEGPYVLIAMLVGAIAAIGVGVGFLRYHWILKQR